MFAFEFLHRFAMDFRKEPTPSGAVGAVKEVRNLASRHSIRGLPTAFTLQVLDARASGAAEILGLSGSQVLLDVACDAPCPLPHA